MNTNQLRLRRRSTLWKAKDTTQYSELVVMVIASTDVSPAYDLRWLTVLINATAVGFAYIEQILNSADSSKAAEKALSIVLKGLELLDKAGFQKIAYEDFYEAFEGLIKEVETSKNPDGVMSHPILLSAFQNPEGDHLFVHLNFH